MKRYRRKSDGETVKGELIDGPFGTCYRIAEEWFSCEGFQAQYGPLSDEELTDDPINSFNNAKRIDALARHVASEIASAKKEARNQFSNARSHERDKRKKINDRLDAVEQEAEALLNSMLTRFDALEKRPYIEAKWIEDRPSQRNTSLGHVIYREFNPSAPKAKSDDKQDIKIACEALGKMTEALRAAKPDHVGDTKTRVTTDALEILWNMFYRGNPKRQAELEQARRELAEETEPDHAGEADDMIQAPRKPLQPWRPFSEKRSDRAPSETPKAPVCPDCNMLMEKAWLRLQGASAYNGVDLGVWECGCTRENNSKPATVPSFRWAFFKDAGATEADKRPTEGN